MMRRILVVGVFMLVMLALATHVTVARADTPNTITQAAITAPTSGGTRVADGSVIYRGGESF
jgi:hypothetical protein